MCPSEGPSRRELLALLGWLAACGTAAATATETGLPQRIHAFTDTLIAGHDLTHGMVISPLNLLEALAPLVVAARGKAAAAMNLLYAGAPVSDDPLAQAEGLWKDLAPPAGTQGRPALSHAAALWLDAGTTSSPQASSALRDGLGVVVQSLALQRPEALAGINGWVADRTAGLVPNVLDEIPAGAVAIITAALYFAARWERAFDPAVTRPEPFNTLHGGPVAVPFMHSAAPATVDFAETDALAGIRLPYADPAFEFVAVKPRAGGNPALVAELAARGSLLATLDGMTFSERPKVDVSLPLVSMGQGQDLLPSLQRGPLAAAFAPDADLTGLLGQPLRISAVRSRTVLQLDEAGTTAAAATAVIADRSLATDRTQFRADLPFLAAVRHRTSGLVIAAALVTDPADVAN